MVESFGFFLYLPRLSLGEPLGVRFGAVGPGSVESNVEFVPGRGSKSDAKAERVDEAGGAFEAAFSAFFFTMYALMGF